MILCVCQCGARAEVELDGRYFARGCWERELEEAKGSGVSADFGKIESGVRATDGWGAEQA
jgi:hypothetical protein